MKRTITIEIDTDERTVYISEDNCTGSQYTGVQSTLDLEDVIRIYIEDNFKEVYF